jgi:FkbM family methyltransferase
MTSDFRTRVETHVRSAARRMRRDVLPASLKRALRRSAIVNRLVPPLTGGEVEVRLALADLLRAGDTAFDVGANVGAITRWMSALVGPRGQVHAFEPNAACVVRLNQAVRDYAVGNCKVIAGAAYDADLPEIDLYVDDRPDTHGVASTVMRELAVPDQLGPGFRSARVRALRLDTYCREAGVEPAVVKIDVEGAELKVLQGFCASLGASRPHVVFEYGSAPASATLQLLEAHGYVLIDLHVYARVGAAEYSGRRLFRNMVAVHQSRVACTPYARLTHIEVAAIAGSELSPRPGHSGHRSHPMPLPAGRYVASYLVTAAADAYVELGCFGPYGGLAGSRGTFDWISQGFQHLVFELSHTAAVEFTFDAEPTAPATLEEIRLHRVELGRP